MLECEMCWHDDEAVKGLGNVGNLKENFKFHVMSACVTPSPYHISCCYARISWSDFHILSQTLIRNQTAAYVNMCTITRRGLFMVIIMNNLQFEFLFFLTRECDAIRNLTLKGLIFSSAENSLKCDNSKKKKNRRILFYSDSSTPCLKRWNKQFGSEAREARIILPRDEDISYSGVSRYYEKNSLLHPLAECL